MKPLTRQHQRQQGTSLVSVLVGVALMGVLVVAMSQTFTNYAKTNHELRVQGDILDTQRYIRNSLSCARTIPNAAACYGYVRGRFADGSELFDVPSRLTVLDNNIAVRATCTSRGAYYAFDVQYRRMSRDGHRVLKSPLTGKVEPWQPLFDSLPITCPKVECLSREGVLRPVAAEGNYSREWWPEFDFPYNGPHPENLTDCNYNNSWNALDYTSNPDHVPPPENPWEPSNRWFVTVDLGKPYRLKYIQALKGGTAPCANRQSSYLFKTGLTKDTLQEDGIWRGRDRDGTKVRHRVTNPNPIRYISIEALDTCDWYAWREIEAFRSDINE